MPRFERSAKLDAVIVEETESGIVFRTQYPWVEQPRLDDSPARRREAADKKVLLAAPEIMAIFLSG